MMNTRFKIFSDPVHGFISVPKGLILDLIQTPEVQRLRRVRQLGVGYLVFPGAEHTRFGHALGAMALMQDVLQTLAEKGTRISQAEWQGAQIVALLHDIGHGPFSHSLEHELISGFQHEQMSRRLIVRLNERFGGALDLALHLFDDRYPRAFFHQLISSQLDMDRLDYLRRDSFYTGVAEGVVGVDRIIKTLRVHPGDGGEDSRIVIESKGSYAVESYLISRRLMYWQVYLHKTVLAGDHLIKNAFRRVRTLVGEPGILPSSSPALLYFLSRTLTSKDLDNEEVVDRYSALDDADVLFSLKQWSHSSDPLLSDLAARFLNRRFFRLTFLDAQPIPSQIQHWHNQISDWMQSTGLNPDPETEDPVSYYLVLDQSRHAAYEPDTDSIGVLGRDGTVHELSRLTDSRFAAALSGPVEKPYVCYPKEVALTWLDGRTVN